MNLQALYVALYSGGLSAVGVWHIVAGDTTERLFDQPRFVRPVGAALFALALPCLLWRGVYFDAMAVVFVASGAMRLFTPSFNIRVQKALYPRWVHGWIMLVGGGVAWGLYRWMTG
ncbi:MAG: hypothetical protein ACLQVI_16480 [Polyangiaceae bacterium]